MTLYVKEYEWMWNDLQLTLAECRIFAYIHGLTHGAKGGYDGSKRHLAELLGLPKSTACKALDTLTEKHLIVYTGSLWKSVPQVDSSGVPSMDESVPRMDKSVLPVRSPHTPLYNNINNKKQADMQTNFEKFLFYFKPSAEYQNRRAATQMLFEARSEVAQKAIIEAAQEGGGGHPGDQKNPYFFVQDFPEPQPTFLRGDEPGDVVQVRYNGAYKLCYRDTMELFGLEFVRNWN